MGKQTGTSRVMQTKLLDLWNFLEKNDSQATEASIVKTLLHSLKQVGKLIFLSTCLSGKL